MGADLEPAVGEGGIGPGEFEKMDLRGPQGDGQTSFERGVHPHPPGEPDDRPGADLFREIEGRVVD